MPRSTISEKQVLDALRTVQEPELHRDLVSLDFIRDIRINGADVAFSVTLTTPACPLKDHIRDESEKAIRDLVPDVQKIDITFDARVRADKRIQDKINLPIKTIVAVGSGKGGVGKSTVSVNLAVGLAQWGAKVGLLDADIYGPNIPTLMGVQDLPPPDGERMVPVLAHGVRVMSMGFLVGAEEALVWRGPMIHSALRQLLTEVVWGELDYLVVDLPPGTGDAQLSLVQNVHVTAGIIVTTPQEVAVGDALRGAKMFEKVGVPLLGIVENMAGFVCPHCGQRTDIFSAGGGKQLATELGVPLLASVPLMARVQELGETGAPVVLQEPDSPAGRALHSLAAQVETEAATRAVRLPIIDG
jgi:ATP-binding protein involved in chromosome partitioning